MQTLPKLIQLFCRNNKYLYNKRFITIKLSQQDFKTYNCEGLPETIEITKQDVLDGYFKMSLIRRMEITADSLYKARLIRGFLHLYIGQEAIAVGIHQGSSIKDSLITAYRCHPFALLHGNSVEQILAELLGRVSGSSRGKGGSMHIFGRNFFGGNAIVGAEVPIGTGIALAQKYLQEEAVTYILYGDGAANQGQVFESFNMAKLWKLPCVYVCENNQYGMGTSVERASASTEYYKRGQFIPGVRVNGMDLLAVKATVRWARQYALENGPIIVEMDTYRFQGHSMSDPGTTYRTREEIQGIRKTRDPISTLKAFILEHRLSSDEQLRGLEQQARDEVAAALENAKNAPFPHDEFLYTDIYSERNSPDKLKVK